MTSCFMLLKRAYAVIILMFFSLINVRLGTIYARAMGHFAEDLDYAFIANKKISGKQRHVWLFSGAPVNQALHQIAVENLFTLNNFLNEVLLRGVMPIISGTSLDASLARTNHTSFIQDNEELFFKIPDDVKRYCESELLQKAGVKIDDEIICISVRNGIHSLELFPSLDHTELDYRNCSPEDIQALLDALVERGYTPILMGRRSNRPYSHEGVFDYSSCDFQSDWFDLYLYSRCKFAVSNSTGVDELAACFRKRTYLINYVPIAGVKNSKLRPIVLPKKHTRVGSLTHMSVPEIMSIGAHKFRSTSEFKDNSVYLEPASTSAQREFAQQILNFEITQEIDSNSQIKEISRSVFGVSDFGLEFFPVLSPSWENLNTQS
jgi:putative glycosyltransferase (TIGR04372 family)